MGRLGQRDLPALLESLRDSCAIRDLAAFPRHVLRAVRHVIPCEYASYAHGIPSAVTAVTEPRSVLEGLERRIDMAAQYVHEHPVFRHSGRVSDGHVWRASDFFTRDQWHRLALYHEYYRQVGVEHQIGLRLPTARSVRTVVGLNRAPGQQDFSDRDLDRLNFLAPHLVQAYRNAEALSRMERELVLVQRGLEKIRRGSVVLEDGRIRLVNGAGRRLLTRYFAGAPRRGQRLPDPLGHWIRHQEEGLNRGDTVPPPREPLVVEREGKRLVMRLLSESGVSLLLLEEQRTSVDRVALEELGLTRREAEVLAWVAEGRTNDDIARILGRRSKTVAKHLEHVFQKLGVETRTAAAVRAREVGG